MTKYAVGTLIVFAVSAVWLFLAWSNGNRTKSWKPVTAEILATEMEESVSGRPRGWRSTISYVVDGGPYHATVDEYLIGKTATVYVNPEDPRQVVGKAGARIQDMGRPLIATIGSGLFALVLLLIAFSPKDD